MLYFIVFIPKFNENFLVQRAQVSIPQFDRSFVEIATEFVLFYFATPEINYKWISIVLFGNRFEFM